MKEIMKELLPGEELLWSAKPEEFTIKDKTNAKAIRLGLVVKIILAAALLGVYVGAMLKSGNAVNVWIVLILAVIMGYIIAIPWLSARKLRKKVVYAVTTKRLLLVTDEIMGASYRCIKEAGFRTDKDGHVTLLIGHEAMKLSASKWRNAAPVNPYFDSQTHVCECMVFYALPEAEKVEELVKQYITLS